MWRRSGLRSWAGGSPSSRRSPGAGSASTSAASPRKALLRNAQLAHLLTREAETFGLRVGGPVTLDYTGGVPAQLEVASPEGRVKGVHFLMRKNEITEFTGRGVFHRRLDPRRHALVRRDRDPHLHRLRDRHRRPRPAAARHEPVRTRRDVRRADPVREPAGEHRDRRGGRDQGVEFAYILNSYGVDVAVVEFLERMVPLEDAEVSKELARRYSGKLGIRAVSHRHPGGEEPIDDSEAREVRVRWADRAGRPTGAGGRRGMLQAIGFAPNVEGYGLERTPGRVRPIRGAIAVDGRGRTNVPHIYAVRDVTAELTPHARPTP